MSTLHTLISSQIGAVLRAVQTQVFGNPTRRPAIQSASHRLKSPFKSISFMLSFPLICSIPIPLMAPSALDLPIPRSILLGMDKGKNTAAKEKEKSYIHWTSEMDYALSSALLEQQALGNKGANGWKGVAFTAGITALWDECQVRMTKEKIMARLKTWNKYFQEVSAMLDTSGFGWDWGRHIVRVDSEDVWADYIKAHPTLKHYKDKVIVNWGDLATLCGTDRANGAAAATGVEAATQIHVEEIADDDAGEGPSHPTRKKVKKISAVDIIAEAVSYIAHNIDGPVETAPVVPPREMTEIEKMYAALARMTDLTEDDLINAMDIVGKDAIKLQIFLVLPEIARRAWLRKQLNEYYNM